MNRRQPWRRYTPGAAVPWPSRKKWQAAAADFQQALKNGRDDEDVLTSYALACLASGDRSGFQTGCKQLIERCGESANSDSASRMVWVCVLSSEGLADAKALDDLTERGNREGRWAASQLIVRGAKLTRSQQWNEAIRSLEEGQVLAKAPICRGPGCPGAGGTGRRPARSRRALAPSGADLDGESR